jgi:hypothetical protein
MSSPLYDESAWNLGLSGAAHPGTLAFVFRPALSVGLAGSVVWLTHQQFAALGVHPWPLWVETAAGAVCAYLLGAAISLGLRRLSAWDQPQSPEDDLQWTASTALWCAPTAILAAHLSPVSLVAAPVLIISITRLTLLRWEESALGTAPVDPASSDGTRFMFESPLRPTGGVVLPVCAAMAAEDSIFMLATARLYLGLGLAGLATALAVLIASRGARHPRRKAAVSARRAALSFLVAVVLAVVGQVLPFHMTSGYIPRGPDGEGEQQPADDTHRLAAPNATQNARKDSNPPQIAGGADGGYPGVILWPEVRPIVLLVPPPQSGAGQMKYSRNPLGIPFGGEYWMYRSPNRHPPFRSYFHRGSPLMGVFQTTDHVPLQVEARQKLEEPIDIDCCSTVRLLILNSDPNPEGVSIELILLGPPRKGGNELSVGMSSISSRPGPSAEPVQESLSYQVPPIRFRFTEFRVVFHRSPDRANKSALIAIDRFVLVPR